MAEFTIESTFLNKSANTCFNLGHILTRLDLYDVEAMLAAKVSDVLGVWAELASVSKLAFLFELSFLSAICCLTVSCLPLIASVPAHSIA